MRNNVITTEFAMAERESVKIVEQQCNIFRQNKLYAKILDSVSDKLVVLNDKRQIVYSNEEFTKSIGFPNNKLLFGHRIGEVLNCTNAFKSEGGCGTTKFCSTCGAVNAMLEVKPEQSSEKECRIRTNRNDAFDFRVKATLFNIDNETLTIFIIKDISDEKRKQTLDRIFFHDVLNSAGGISGLSSLMPEIKDTAEMKEIAEMISRASENLISEIQGQRYYTAAENGDLTVEATEIESFKILKDLADLYSRHEIVADKFISISSDSENIIVETDPILLRRIIGNMIKNAIEASMPASVVTISSAHKNGIVRFTVHNTTYIPNDVQLQLFQRSFTTKGIGRGIGTYSMKLLGENYLKGKVGFESTKQNGTTFYIEI